MKQPQGRATAPNSAPFADPQWGLGSDGHSGSRLSMCRAALDIPSLDVRERIRIAEVGTSVISRFRTDEGSAKPPVSKRENRRRGGRSWNAFTTLCVFMRAMNMKNALRYTKFGLLVRWLINRRHSLSGTCIFVCMLQMYVLYVFTIYYR